MKMSINPAKYIEDDTWVHVDMELFFEYSTWYLTSERSERDIKLNTRKEIPYLQAAMYYSVYYISQEPITVMAPD